MGTARPERDRFTREELDELTGTLLPERAAMSVLANMARMDAALAADAISDDLTGDVSIDETSSEERS